MSNHKARIAKLERQDKPQRADVFLTVRKIDYRADIIQGVKAAADSIPVKITDAKHEQP